MSRKCEDAECILHRKCHFRCLPEFYWFSIKVSKNIWWAEKPKYKDLQLLLDCHICPVGKIIDNAKQYRNRLECGAIKKKFNILCKFNQREKNQIKRLKTDIKQEKDWTHTHTHLIINLSPYRVAVVVTN